MTRIAPSSRLPSVRVRTRLSTLTRLAIAPTLSVALLACGSGRNYDNPPEISPITAGSSTSTSSTTSTTVFVPTTAPTTLGPVTEPPTAPPPPPPPPTPPPTPPPPPTTPPPTTGETYAVVGGDTLSGISRRLGVTLDALLAANNLNANSLITPGQRLQIPAGGSVPVTNAPTNPPATDAPATNPPGTSPPGTSPPATNPPGTSRPTSPQVQPTTTFAAPPGAVQPTGASATCQAPDSVEANGTPIVFRPSNVLDHNPGSGWRCQAPATGQSLTVSLGAATHLASVGMIGGYDKLDPLTGVDRWPQNHRVRQVRWTFSDGTTVTQDLADSRGMQSINVDVTTTSVKIEILSTYPPSGPDQKQTVVVAEVQLLGG